MAHQSLNIESGFLQFDDPIAAVDALETAAEHIEAVEVCNTIKWEGVLITLHNTVQGIRVLAINWKTVLLGVGMLVLVLGSSSSVHARQSTSESGTCDGFDAYASNLLQMQDTYWLSVRNDDLLNRDPVAFTDQDWITSAEHAEAAQATFKVLEPPEGVAGWHRVQITDLGFRGFFSRLAASNGFAAAAAAVSDARAAIETDRSEELVLALETCPGSAEFFEQFVVLGFSDQAYLLFEQLVQGFEDQGYSLDPGARALLADLVQHAAWWTDADSQLTLATFAEAAPDLVDAAIENAQRRGEDIITPQGLREVLCPIWPIC